MNVAYDICWLCACTPAFWHHYHLCIEYSYFTKVILGMWHYFHFIQLSWQDLIIFDLYCDTFIISILILDDTYSIKALVLQSICFPACTVNRQKCKALEQKRDSVPFSLSMNNFPNQITYKLYHILHCFCWRTERFALQKYNFIFPLR